MIRIGNKVISLEAIVVFLLIYISNDTFFFGTNSMEWCLAIPRYGAILLVAILLIKKKNRIRMGMIIPMLIMLLLMVISGRHNHDSITFMMIYLIYIVLAYLIATRININVFFYYFETIMYFLAKASIVIGCISYVMPGIIRAFPIAYNTNGVEIYCMGVGNIFADELSSIMIRNSSIFWEPGVFSIYLSIAISYLMFEQRNQVSIRKWIIYGVAQILTFSTAGYVVTLFLLIIYVLFAEISIQRKFLMVIGLILISGGIIGIDSSVFSNVFSKITGKTGTTVTRYAGILVNYKLALDYPLLGVGISKMNQYMLLYSSRLMSQTTSMNTNGILYPFAAYGIPFGVTYIIGLFNLGKYYSKSRIMHVLMIIFIFLLFFAERLMSALPYILCFYGYSLGLKKNLKSNN